MTRHLLLLRRQNLCSLLSTESKEDSRFLESPNPRQKNQLRRIEKSRTGYFGNTSRSYASVYHEALYVVSRLYREVKPWDDFPNFLSRTTVTRRPNR